jgi:hypothetical protein
MRQLIRAIAVLMSLSGPVVAGADEDAVAHLLHATFDKPDSRLVVDPVVVSGQHAIAGWTQGDMGGRALLRSKGGHWALVLCAGDGLKAAAALQQAGIGSAEAQSLTSKLADAERALPPARLALLAKFEGIVLMGPSGAHPH